METPDLKRPHSSAVEHLLDKQEVAGSNPATVTVMERNDVRFYGYKHWTLEEFPRCFYVGKGLRKRPYSDRRSKKWHAIVAHYGLRVEVVCGPLTNTAVCDWEVENILYEGTFSTNHHHNSDDIGCNFTLGGDGVSGRFVSDDARKRIGAAQRGLSKSREVREKISNALKDRKLSDETRQRMNDAHVGKPLSKVNKSNLWKNRDRTFSDAHRQSLSRAAQTRKCSLCRQSGHRRTSCPLGGQS